MISTAATPDHVKLVERFEDRRPILHCESIFHTGLASAVNIDRPIAEYNFRTGHWDALVDISNMERLEVDRVNGLAGILTKLCYNCHGLKSVDVHWTNHNTGRSGKNIIPCPTCKGRGCIPKGEQLRLVK